jgi:uncharacterized protein (DUF302 family)
MRVNKTTVVAVAGLAAAVALMKVAMPALMLSTHESKFAGVEETAAALKAAIEEAGWSCPAVRDMNASMAKEGVTFEEPVRIVELCKAEYAKAVLTDNPEVSTLMPCAWGVYKKEGKVYITGMNTGLMGKLFGGTIARVMGGSVAKDEAAILKKVTRH